MTPCWILLYFSHHSGCWTMGSRWKEGGKVHVAQAADSCPSHMYTGGFLMWNACDCLSYPYVRMTKAWTTPPQNWTKNWKHFWFLISPSNEGEWRKNIQFTLICSLSQGTEYSVKGKCSHFSSSLFQAHQVKLESRESNKHAEFLFPL